MATTTTTKKTTKKEPAAAAKKAPVKKDTPVTAKTEVAEAKTIETEVAPAADTVVKKKFAPGDYIPCRSVRSGHMQHISRKSGMSYEWADFGDICDVEYGDLLALKAGKSKFMYEPWFIIEDDQLVEEWKLAGLYGMFTKFEDAEDFLLQGAVSVRRDLMAAPQGYKDLIVDTAGRMIRSGMLDSIATIQVIDDVMHTQLGLLIGGRN